MESSKSYKVNKENYKEDIQKSSSACKENKQSVSECICKEGISVEKCSLSSKSSLQSNEIEHSVEWLMKTPSCLRHPAPYSDETKRQIPTIKALVEKQEAETMAKEKAAKEGKTGSTEVGPQVSTTFAQDMVFIQEQIRKGREEWERQEAERKALKKLKKQQKKDVKEKEDQKAVMKNNGGGEVKKE